MNTRFIEQSWIPLHYELKQGTKGSFYQKWGKSGILPNRLSIGIFAQKKTSANDSFKKNEINGQYKKSEAGIYSSLNNRRIHSSIWEAQQYPEYYGYGILDERHNIFDLLVIYSEDNLASSMEIHLFRGMGKPEFLESAFKFLRQQKQKAPLLGLNGISNEL